MVDEIAHEPADTRARLRDIKRIEREQGIAAAEKALVDLLRAGPQTAGAFIALSRILMKQRKFDDALRVAGKARAMAPLDVEPVVAIGFVNLRLRDNPAAAEAFAEAIRLDATSADAMLGAAAVKLADEQYDEALELASRALELDPSMERANGLIARIQSKRGDKTAALFELEAAIAKNPANLKMLKSYLKMSRKAGSIEDARSFLERVAASNPNERTIQRALSQIRARLGEDEFSTEKFQGRLAEGRIRPQERVKYVQSLIKARRYDEAREAAAPLSEQKALRPVGLKLGGDITLKSGDPEAAVAQYRAACKAARVDPIDPDEEAQAQDVTERALLWRSHAQSRIMDAIRERRARD